MSTFTATNSYSLATHDVMFDGYVMKIKQGKNIVATHDLASSSIAIKVQSGNFCTGYITWGAHHFTKVADQSGPCADIAFDEANTKFVGTDNDGTGNVVYQNKYDISECPIEIWVDGSEDELYMKCPCDTGESCSSSDCYELVNAGTCAGQ